MNSQHLEEQYWHWIKALRRPQNGWILLKLGKLDFCGPEDKIWTECGLKPWRFICSKCWCVVEMCGVLLQVWGELLLLLLPSLPPPASMYVPPPSHRNTDRQTETQNKRHIDREPNKSTNICKFLAKIWARDVYFEANVGGCCRGVCACPGAGGVLQWAIRVNKLSHQEFVPMF